MSTDLSEVDRVAEAVLYEGYLLYPYRPSAVKNRQRWTFGVVYPADWSTAQGGIDSCVMQSECLLRGPAARVHVRVRFLHLLERTVGELEQPWLEGSAGPPAWREVPVLRVGDRTWLPWQEAVEREVRADVAVADLLTGQQSIPFGFPARRDLEGVPGPDGAWIGVLSRAHRAIVGDISLAATLAGADLVRLTVRIHNRTPLHAPQQTSRDEILLHCLASSHAILRVEGGAFVSLLDPPEDCRAAAAACQQAGAWPILAGDEGSSGTVLCTPIILYDYPRVAPESPGDLFDATEIDEILTLRILTMTDEEKREMCATDERARRVLERTEALVREQMMGLHGAVRGLRPVQDDG